MSNETRNRQKAKELGAPDARELVATVPRLNALLSADDIAQIQRVVDAAILNPMYEEAYRKAMREAVISRAGNLVLRDRSKERRARRILDKRIAVSGGESRIRVDHKKMLTADALTPRTNNPDEAEYLVKVRQILNTRGVWLRLSQPYDARGRDPKVWEFWFSLGRDGEAIETEDAIIDRDELLGITMVGAGYYRSVLTGHVQTKLKRAFATFDRQYDSGFDLHAELIRNRRSAPPGVAAVSDFLGGVRIPALSIWERAHKMRLKAAAANDGGDVNAAQVYLLVATNIVEYNAELLSDYARGTAEGAEFAVEMLEVAEAAGAVAGAVLTVTGAGIGVRALRAAGSRAAVRDARDEAAAALVRRYAKREGISEAELAMVRYVPQPKGTVLGAMRGGHSGGRGVGAHRWP